MRRHILIKNNSAVAGVIEFLLIIALIAIILSTVQAVYIPDVMSQREADHMKEVSNELSYLKSIIDLQAMTEKDVPISSPITLGNDPLPYFVTMGASGGIEIVEDARFEINIDFDSTRIPLTKFNFTAYNAYYLQGDDLNYALEGGAVILNQTEGEVIRVEPAISVENQSTVINIYYDLPIIISIAGKNNTYGSDTVHVRTNYSSSDATYQSHTNADNIKIYTDYPEAWKEYLEEILEDNVNYIVNDDNVELTKKVKNVNFYYKRTYIYAQISPGWIK